MTSALKALAAGTNQLLTVVMDKDERQIGLAVKDTTRALQSMSLAAQEIAATSRDHLQKEILPTTIASLSRSFDFIGAIGKSLINHADPFDPNYSDYTNEIQEAAKLVQDCLQCMVEILPGQRDLTMALATINSSTNHLEALEKELVESQTGLGKRHSDEVIREGDLLNDAIVRFTQAATQLGLNAAMLVVAVRSTPDQVAIATSALESNFNEIIQSSEAIIMQRNNKNQDNDRVQSINLLKSLANATSGLLLAVSQARSNPNGSTGKGVLSQKAKEIQIALDNLVANISPSNDNVRICENVLRDMKTLLANTQENPTEPINDLKYMECVAMVTAMSGSLISVARTILNPVNCTSTDARNSMILAVENGDQLVKDMTNATMQAAYLIGVSDPLSTPAIPCVIDSQAILQSQALINKAINVMSLPESSPQEILLAIATVDKQSSLLSDWCMRATMKISNPGMKADLIACGKAIVNSTTALLNTINPLALTSDTNHTNEGFTETNAANIITEMNNGKVNTNHNQEIVVVEQEPEKTLVKSADQLKTKEANEVNEINSATNSLCKMYANATIPLVNSVNQLVALSLMEECAARPAILSDTGKERIQLVLADLRPLVISSITMVDTASQMTSDQYDSSASTPFSELLREMDQAVKGLATAIQINTPGRRACDEVISTIKDSIGILNQSSLAASVGALKLRSDNDLQGFQEAIINSLHDIKPIISNIVASTNGQSQNLESSLALLAENFLTLTSASTGAATKLSDRKSQQILLDKVKITAEEALKIVTAVQESISDQNKINTKMSLDDAVVELQLGLSELLDQVTANSGEEGGIGLIAAQVRRITASLDNQYRQLEDVGHSHLQYISLAQDHAQGLVANIAEIYNVNPDGLLDNLRLIADQFDQLVMCCKGAIATTDDEEMQLVFHNSSKALSQSFSTLVAEVSSYHNNPDSDLRKHLVALSQPIAKDISTLFIALQKGMKGIRACDIAMNRLDTINSDIDTTIMFTAAGALESENEEDRFDRYKEALITQSHDLIDKVELLLASCHSEPDALAHSVTITLDTIDSLVENLKFAAASMGSEDRGTQELLLLAVREVVEAEQRVIRGVSLVAMKDMESTESNSDWEILKREGQHVTTLVTSLLKTIQSVGDESTRGIRATDSAIDGIQLELDFINSNVTHPPRRKEATPENLTLSIKNITVLSNRLVSSISNHSNVSRATSTSLVNTDVQKEIMQCANGLRKAVVEMIQSVLYLINSQRLSAYIGKGAIENCEVNEEEIRNAALVAIQASAQRSLDLLIDVRDCLKEQPLVEPAEGKWWDEKKIILSNRSKAITTSTNEVINTAKVLKGIPLDDLDDPHVIAEQQLAEAAFKIDESAMRLDAICPKGPVGANQEGSFEEMIGDMSRGIMSATVSLMNAAQTTQRDLMQQGLIHTLKGTNQYQDDVAWCQGLVNAANGVAKATRLLTEAIGAVTKGNESGDQIISAATNISAATQQLLLAY
eukprot:Ihof_evm4s210 gene=Ihof_evmTU4s210